MVAKLEISVGANDNILIFKDATPSYGGEVISDRFIEIETSEGVLTIPFPFTGNIGDEVSHEFSKPFAVRAELNLIPVSPINSSTYIHEAYTAMLNKYEDFIKNKVNTLIYSIDPKNILTSPQGLLRDLEWSKALFDSAGEFIREGDITASQECIDGLEEISKR